MSPATRASLYIVMLLACHASIERQKQTGSETGGWIVRLWIRFAVQTPMWFAARVSETCETPAAHYFPRMKTVADAVRYETFSLILANIFTATRIWNMYYETTEIVFASHYRVEIVNIHLFDLRLLWWIHFVKAIYPCLRYTMALLLSEFKDQCRSILCNY